MKPRGMRSLVIVPGMCHAGEMKFRSLLCRAVLVLALFLPFAARAQSLKLPGSLNLFLEDPEIWKLAPDELAARLQPLGYCANPASGHKWLGEPREMLKRGAHLFTPDNPVWAANLPVAASLRCVNLDFLAPATIAKTPDKSAWRAMFKRLETGLTAVLRAAPAPHPPEVFYAEADRKSVALRWISPAVCAVLTASHRESGRNFTPTLLQLRLTRTVALGKADGAGPVAAAVDRKTGAITLEGVPAVPQWEGSHPDWAVIEQALHSTGLVSDRNGILEQQFYGISWPDTFCPGVERLAAMSGARAVALQAFVLGPGSAAALHKDLTAEGKKLNRPAPQVLRNLQDVDPLVLRAARTRGNAVPQLMAAVRKTLAAGRPVVWYGFRGIYPEEPAVPQGLLTTSLRLVTGCVPGEDVLIFAGPDGKPTARIKAADALAASLYIADIQKK